MHLCKGIQLVRVKRLRVLLLPLAELGADISRGLPVAVGIFLTEAGPGLFFQDIDIRLQLANQRDSPCHTAARVSPCACAVLTKTWVSATRLCLI